MSSDDPKAPVTFTPTNEATFTPVADEKNTDALTTAQQRLQKIAERMGSDVAEKVAQSMSWYLDRIKATAERATTAGEQTKAFARQEPTAKKRADDDEPPLGAPVPATPKPPVTTPGLAAALAAPPSATTSPTKFGASLVGETGTLSLEVRERMRLSSVDRMTPMMLNAFAGQPSQGQRGAAGQDAANLSPSYSFAGMPKTAAASLASTQQAGQMAGAFTAPGATGWSRAANQQRDDQDDKLLRAIEKLCDRIEKLTGAMGGDESEGVSQRRTEWNVSGKPEQKPSMWREIPAPSDGGGTYRNHL